MVLRSCVLPALTVLLMLRALADCRALAVGRGPPSFCKHVLCWIHFAKVALCRSLKSIHPSHLDMACTAGLKNPASGSELLSCWHLCFKTTPYLCSEVTECIAVSAIFAPGPATVRRAFHGQGTSSAGSPLKVESVFYVRGFYVY